MQHVQASLLPFHLHRKTLEVPSGLSLEQMVECVFPRKIPGIRIVVNIGDEVVPRSQWKSIKPKPMTLVGINAVAAGGGGGKKNPLAAIIAIALIVAAPYIVAAIAPAASAAVAAGTATLGQTLTVGAIRMGISMVGFLATSMLSSVPKQRAQAAPSPSESTTQFIEGASNSISRYAPIPVPLGVNRMFPNQAALPYTETTDNKQYVRQLFTYGFGNVLIADRKIGETALIEYDGVEMIDRLNGDLNTGTALYSNDVVQDGYSVTISAAAGYITRTTQDDVDEAQVDITFTGGLTEYNSQAQRQNRTVQFEVRYALTGTTNWINRATDVSYGSQSVTVPYPTAWNATAGKRIGYAIIVLNISNGVASAVSYDAGSSPIIPPNCIRIGSLRTESTSPTPGGGNIFNLVDERANYIPSIIKNSGDFALSYGGTGLNVGIAAGVIAGNNVTVTDATAQALRITKAIKFPTRDQYDIQVKRLTADSVSDQIRDVATLTAIRSIRYTEPVTQENVSGTAVRMLGTDQLNGTIDRYNCTVSTLMKDYDSVGNTWISDVVTSNPASIYRYVLQASAFIKALPDNRIDLDKLEEWHTFCKQKNLTYNRIVDQPTSIDDLLNDIAAAGMATPHKINGNYSVLIDNDRPDIKGMVTPRNSWGYNGSITYPDLPHALRVQFRNAAKGYIVDERIVYADGYNEGNATLYERLQFDSCTNSDLAWFYGRIYMATVLLQPEVHNFNMDFENLSFNRGDKIVFVNDVILVGVGQGRIKELIYDDPDTPTEVLGFTIDELVNIPTVDNFGVRIRHGDATGFTYHAIATTVGDADTFNFSTPIPIASAPPLDSLCAFTEFGQELELVITEIRMNKDHSASVTAVNYAPERYDAVTGSIPPFDSNITLPANFYRPLAPVLAGAIQSDESVMLKNSDGSYTTRMIIPLTNRNEPSVQTVLRARPTGATQFFRPDILSSTPEQVILTGLQDGMPYDFRIFYQRPGGSELLSPALELNNITYEGAFGKPDDVEGFNVTVSDTLGIFDWFPNLDIDLSHYKVRFSSLTTGASWVNSQIIADNITTNRITLPIQKGTYLIKAVDILDNESVNAAVIVSNDNGALGNVVELLTQNPTWPGVKDNVQVIDNNLYLINTELPGYYYFDPDPFSLGDVYESFLSSSLIAAGAFYNRINSIPSIRAIPSIRGGLGTVIRTIASIRSLNSIRGVDPEYWSVHFEIQKSDDDITYTDWELLTAGKHSFNFLRIRLVLESFTFGISPRVNVAEVLIDMPDRLEKAEDVPCPNTGLTVVYETPFKNNPAVNITLQNGATDDKLEFISKDNEGFTVKVFNQTAGTYVSRVLDYIAAGYGRTAP